MPENTDSGQQAVGEQVTPNPEASPPADDKQTSSVTAEPLEVVLQRLEAIEGTVRGLKSDNDRGVHKLSKKVDSYVEKIAKYEERRSKGLEPEAALRELQIDELLADRDPSSQTDAPANDADGTAELPAGVDAQVLEGLGLEANSPEVVELLRRDDASLNDFLKLAIQQGLKNQQPANPATITPTGSGETVGSDNLEAVTAELDAEIAKELPNHEKVRELQKKQSALLPRK
jgi:hypothetical protein